MKKTRSFENPFHDLWVTEILDSTAYVDMFSPLLVSDAEELFASGNVVVRGRQGSGKSMLLNLLQTSTRLAYVSTQKEYPVPENQRNFISAGIQFSTESAALVASRASEIPQDVRQQVLAMCFSDYVNTILSLDLLRNVIALHDAQQHGRGVKEVQVQVTKKSTAKFAKLLTRTTTWPTMGVTEDFSLDDLVRLLESRLKESRQYYNFNIDQLPAEIESSRAAVGEPIAELAATLRSSSIIGEETLIFLRLDQHEELFELERHTKLGSVFRQVINGALAKRDSRIAYRIGTRHYAWERDLTCWGSGAPLEHLRDYSIVDLDTILRKAEHTRNWKFPLFAKDVVNRRLQAAGFNFTGNATSKMFGVSMSPFKRARIYVGASECTIRVDPEWSDDWKNEIKKLWESGEPLEAKFCDAWLRQRSQRSNRTGQGSVIHPYPWRKNPWWTKERSEIALIHLAASRRQAVIWSGERQLISLAGYNILAFMTICKAVWSTWQRRNPTEAEPELVLPVFSIDDQVMGVLEASHLWYKKIQVGLESDRRLKFVNALGSWFRRQLLDDQSLSYPGHNGFSLFEAEIFQENDVVRTIKSCRDHGDLLEADHTTKERNQNKRLKWYLHPLLCPFYRIPFARTKEPIYTSTIELTALLAAPHGRTDRKSEAPEQTQLQLGLSGDQE